LPQLFDLLAQPLLQRCVLRALHRRQEPREVTLLTPEHIEALTLDVDQ